MWEILGNDTQVLTMVLKPNEVATCRPGAVITRDDSINIVENAGWLDIEAREKYVNSSQRLSQSMTFVAPFSGSKIVSIRMGYPMVVRPGAWLASKGADVLFEFGEGGLSVVSGTAPTFICGRGTIMSRMLARGESIVAKKSSFLACARTVQVKEHWSLCVLLFGCDYRLTGPGMVLLQSLNAAHLF